MDGNGGKSRRQFVSALLGACAAGGAAFAPSGGAASATARAAKTVSARDFGAKGDGVTNDTAAIQQAINAAHKSGGGTVSFPKGTYLLRRAGTKKCILFSGGAFGQDYCLELKSGVALDLGGSRLRLDDRQNACLIVNAGLLHTDPTDTNLTIRNGILDGNNTQQTVARAGMLATINIINARNVTLKDLRFDHVRDLAINLMKVEDCTGTNWTCTYSDGDAFGVGGFTHIAPNFDMRVHNGRFENLRAENLQNGLYPAGPGFRQGNPVLSSAVKCAFDRLYAKDCGGGYKFLSGCEDVTVGEAVFLGAKEPTRTNATENSGFKIQGDTPGYPPRRITVQKVESTDSQGGGLYIEYAEECRIKDYRGKNNSRAGTRPDVWIGRSEGIVIEKMVSEDSGFEGVQVRAQVNGWELGEVTILNPAQKAPASGISIQGKKGRARAILVKDTTGRMTYGLGSFSDAAQAVIESLDISGGKRDAVSKRPAGLRIRKLIRRDR